MEAEFCPPFLRQAAPIFERCVEQPECADDVGFDERRRPVDRAVDVRFRRQMHDGVGLLVGKNGSNLPAVANVAAMEPMMRRIFN